MPQALLQSYYVCCSCKHYLETLYFCSNKTSYNTSFIRYLAQIQKVEESVGRSRYIIHLDAF